MFSELLKRCLLGDRIASAQLFLQITLHHSLENLFKRMGLEPKLMIVPTPNPGPPSFEWGKAISEKNFLHSLRELRHSEPSFISREVQKEALQKFRSELEKSLWELDREIKTLEQVSP